LGQRIVEPKKCGISARVSDEDLASAFHFNPLVSSFMRPLAIAQVIPRSVRQVGGGAQLVNFINHGFSRHSQ
jgi:hypothetical protein